MTVHRRWGKAGVRLTPAEIAAADARAARRRYDHARANQAAHRQWAAGLVVPHRITLALNSHALYGPDVDTACEAQEPEVDMWEAGTLYPRWHQLLALARLTGKVPGFFMVRDTPIPDDRTSLRFHIPVAERGGTPPVMRFTPDAIAAMKETLP